MMVLPSPRPPSLLAGCGGRRSSSSSHSSRIKSSSSHAPIRSRSRCARVSASGAAPAANDAAPPSNLPTPFPRGRVLIAPAFYLDARLFRPLAAELRRRGYDAALAPIRWYFWTATLGGRSQRPILDRLDWALEDLTSPSAAVDPDTLELPPRGNGYSILDFLLEMRDPSQGARPLHAASAPPPRPLPAKEKAAIVASSAAGWICRILLSGARIVGGAGPYGGRAYVGAPERCHTLITLGTPHYSEEAVTKKNTDWVNDHTTKPDGVRFVAVGATGVRGKELWPGSNLGDFVFESYKLCSGDGKDDGDGVTPLKCALALEGAEALVSLEGADHTPPLFGARKKADWYGEGAFLESWVGYLAPPGKEEEDDAGEKEQQEEVARNKAAAGGSSGSSGGGG
jgi:hypothetical protein